LGDPPVDGLELVQRGLGLGDLHLGGGEAAAQRGLGEVAGEEGLAAAVFAAHRLDHGASVADLVELGRQRLGEVVQADGELVESLGWDGAAAQRSDDVVAPPGGDARAGGAHPCTSNCSRASEASRMTVSSSRRSTSNPSTFRTWATTPATRPVRAAGVASSWETRLNGRRVLGAPASSSTRAATASSGGVRRRTFFWSAYRGDAMTAAPSPVAVRGGDVGVPFPYRSSMPSCSAGSMRVSTGPAGAVSGRIDHHKGR